MLIKIILLGLCVSLINMLLRQHQKIFVMPLNIFFAVSVFILIFSSVSDSIKDIIDCFTVSSTVSKVLTCLYKSAAICILTKVSSDICKESGNTVISDIIDLGARVMLLVIALPFVESIIKTATAFVK